MKIATTTFIESLRERGQENLRLLEELAALPDEDLNRRPDEGAWTALEALKHINTFNRAYQGRSVEAVRQGESPLHSEKFSSGFLGRIIANWARPGKKTIKLSAPKKVNYHGRPLDRGVLEQSIEDAREFISLLDRAQTVDLGRTKVVSMEFDWLKFRLGDTLRIVANHNWRHIEQAVRATRGEAGIRTK